MPLEDKYLARRELQDLADEAGPYSAFNAAAEQEAELRIQQEADAKLELEAYSKAKGQARAGQATFDRALATEDTINKSVFGESGPEAAASALAETSVEQKPKMNAQIDIPEGAGPAYEPTGQESSAILDDEADARRDLAEKKKWNSYPLYRELRDYGYTEMAAKTFLDPNRQALIQVTSPLEVFGAGGAVAAKLGGKIALAGFTLGFPAEMAGTIVGEEIMEDNMAVGLTIAMLSGGLANIAGDMVIAQRTTAALFNKAIASATDERVAKIAGRYSKGIADAPRGKSMKAEYGATYNAPVKTTREDFTTGIYAPATQLNRRRATVETRKLTEKVIQGDLRDPETRSVIEMVVRDSKAIDLAPEEAVALKSLENKLQQAPKAAVVQDTAPDAPLVESSSPQVSKATSGAIRNEQTPEWYYQAPATAEAPLGLSSKVQAALTKRVEREWYGKPPKKAPKGVSAEEYKYMGSDFQEDLRAGVKEAMAEARANGQVPNRKEVRARVKADLVKEYETGIAEDIRLRASDVREDSLQTIRKRGVQGGTEEPDARFITPAGEIGRRPITDKMRAGINQGILPYKFNDWVIEDNLVYTDASRNLVYKSDLDIAPTTDVPLPPNNNTSGLFDYSKIETKGQAEYYIKGMIHKNQQANKGGWKKVDGKWRKTSEADKYKVDVELPPKEPGGPPRIQPMLKESEMESIGQLYGWGPHKLQVESSMGKDGRLFQMVESDIIANKALKEEYDILHPNYFKNQERDFETSERAPKYWAMKGGEGAYRRQREAYLRKAIGFEADDPKYYTALDDIAITRNQLIDDIAYTQRGPQEGHTKRMYLLYGDILAGTDRFGTVNRMTRAQAREVAYAEMMDMQAGSRSAADIEASIIKFADKENMTLEDAAEVMASEELYRVQAQDELSGAFERLGREAGEIDGPEPTLAGKASDRAGTSMQVYSVDETPSQQFTRLTRQDRLALSEQMASIEDRFGVRVVDDMYIPGGRMNLFKINTMKDVDSLLKVFDAPVDTLGAKTVGEVLLDDVDPVKVIGLKANASHDQELVNRLTFAINDTQVQLGALADKLIAHPKDVLNAVAFEKMRAINGILSTHLVDGTPSGQSLKALENLNFTAFDDMSMVDVIAKAVDNNYKIYKQFDPDISRTTAVAHMYADIKMPTQRGKLMHGLAATDEYIKLTDNMVATVTKRKAVTKKLAEACD